MDSKIDEYVKKFGGNNRFVRKILDSLDCPFAIVNVATHEIEITNSRDFFPGMKCSDLFKVDEVFCSSDKCPLKNVFFSGKSVIVSETSFGENSFEVHAHPILDSSGKVVSVIIYKLDAPQSQALVESEKKFHSLFEGNVDAIFITDPKTNKLVDCNEAAMRLIGCGKGDIVGTPLINLIPKDKQGDATATFTRHSKGERIIFETEVLRKDGKTKIPVSINTSIVAVNGVTLLQGVFRDISEREQTEHMSREKDETYIKEIEERFYSILQNSQDLVYRYDFIKDSFDYVSESVFTILGYSLIEFMTMNRGDYNKRIHPDDANIVDDIGDDSEEESTSIVEYRFKKKNGEYIWLKVKSVFFRDKNGKLIYSIEAIRDISKRKSDEEEKVKLEERLIRIRDRSLEAKERVSLTDREKLVLWGFCRYPLLNDEELANNLELKRSTLTAIKNRLKGKGWFNLSYVPNFYKLGCQFFTIFDANLKNDKGKGLELVKGTPNVVVSNYQDDKLLAGFTSDKYVDVKRFLEQVMEIDGLKHRLNKNSFFYDLDDISLYDVSGLVNSLFSLNKKEKPAVYKFKNEATELSINEKRVLHAMVKDPEMSSSEIAKKIWTSKPTVIKVKKKLLDKGYVYPYIVLDLRKMGFPYIARLSFEFDSDLSMAIGKESHDDRVILQISGKKKITKIMLFANEEEYEEEVGIIKKFYHKKGIDFTLDSEIFAVQKRKSSSLKMESFVSDRLFGDDL